MKFWPAVEKCKDLILPIYWSPQIGVLAARAPALEIAPELSVEIQQAGTDDVDQN